MRLLLAFLSMLLSCSNLLEALDRYLPAGRTTHHWETYTHNIEADLGTLPEQATSPWGATTRADGKVAAIFTVGFSSHGPRHRILLVFAMDPARDPVWEIVEGPYRIEYPAPVNAGQPDIWIQGAITEYTLDRYAMLGYWQEDADPDPERIFLRHHLYLLTVPRSGGTPTILFKFPDLDWDRIGFGEMAYLPADGDDPACFVFANPNPGGERGGFVVFDTTGNLLREIPPESLFLATEAGQCNYSSSLEALPNGELMAVASDFEATGCPDRAHEIAVIFDRYGTYKGTWAFGASLLLDPWEPYGFNAIAVLPSGHVYASSLFAAYYWESTHTDSRYGDDHYHTYRHFLVAPPFELNSPLLETSASSIRFGPARIGETQHQALTLRNLGSAELVVSTIAMHGSGGQMQWTGPETLSLLPSYGLRGTPGSEATHLVEVKPLMPGRLEGSLHLESNDPTSPQKDLPLSAFSVPAGYGFRRLANLTASVEPPHPALLAQISSGGGSALVAVHVNDDGPPHTRLLRLPLTRSAGLVNGVDASGAVIVADLDRIAGTELVEGPAGTVWISPLENSANHFLQLLPDGTLLQTPLPMGGAHAPQAFCFVPGADIMLVCRRFESQVHLLQLQPREGGGYDLEYIGPAGPAGPREINRMLMWAHGGKSYTLAQMGGEVWLSVALIENFLSGSASAVEPRLIAFDLEVLDYAYDPVARDLLILEPGGDWVRFSGYEGMLSDSLGLAFALNPLRLRVGGPPGSSVRIETAASPATGPWTLLDEILISVDGPNEVPAPNLTSGPGLWFRALRQSVAP